MSALLEVRDLAVTFRTRRGDVRAVDGISYDLDAGETLGIVGESGSGKSVAHLALLDLLRGARVEAARLVFDGRDLAALDADARRRLRGREMAMVFQDPLSALNPFLTIGLQLAEVLEVHANATRRAALSQAAAALDAVGIPDASERLRAYPHELSGGMRQRVMIAMALLCKPRLLVADEPTTALDVTIQAQVLDVLQDMQRRHGTAIALITHSLGVVAGRCERVLVMYAGRVVEEARTDELFRRPLHPYTEGLLSSVPRLDTPLGAPLPSIPGSPPVAGATARGCAFAPRCGIATGHCVSERPELARALAESERRSACFLSAELAQRAEAAP